MLRRTVREFIVSESGVVSARTGLPVAWVVGLLLAAAVILGPDPAEASTCKKGYLTLRDCHKKQKYCGMKCSEGWRKCSRYMCSVHDDDLCYCY